MYLGFRIRVTVSIGGNLITEKAHLRAVAFLVNSRNGVFWFTPASKYMESNIKQAAL